MFNITENGQLTLAFIPVEDQLDGLFFSWQTQPREEGAFSTPQQIELMENYE